VREHICRPKGRSRANEYLNAKQFGDYGEGETPVPIPNTDVKTFSAEDTWRETSWERRSSPGEREEGPDSLESGPFLVRPAWAESIG
jgi:hypothetical protein